MSERENGQAVAWLRIFSSESRRLLYAGLLETSPIGEPLGFSFTWGDATGSHDDVTFLAERLIRSLATQPVLVFGVADEISELSAQQAFSGVYACRLPQSDDEDNGAWTHADACRMSWGKDAPNPGSSADLMLAQLLQSEHPFEPLERAASGLKQAFKDARVEAMTRISRLNAVMTLPPPSERRMRPLAGGSAGAVVVRNKSENDFADGLWERLAVPEFDWSASETGAPLEWPGELMPFQRQGVRALIGMKQILLSDDMGLGKTVQAIAALRILKAQGKIASSLVVAPASILNQWRQELSRWAPELSAIIVRGAVKDRDWQWRAVKDVVLVSYDVIRQDVPLLDALARTGKVWDLVVLDEAQKIKNRNKTGGAAKRIRRLRSWALTGTPIENDEEELASIMEFVDYQEGTPLKRYKSGPALRLRHRELQLRRKKSDVLPDLPPKLETLLSIPLKRQQRLSYDKAEFEGIVYLKSLGSEVGIQHILELITRLKQICNADPRTGESSKLDDISERLSILTAQGHRALVFSQYTSDASGVALAAKHLRSFEPLSLTGEIPVEMRSAVIDQFKSNEAHKALIISLRVGGLGLNLQEASYVFHLDRWWNPALERQAEDRTHRMGQTVKVNVIKYSCENTIEQRIDQILLDKQELFDALVDDVSMDLSARLTRSELLGLFGLG